jgi:hypothetical protein
MTPEGYAPGSLVSTHQSEQFQLFQKSAEFQI